MTDETTSFPPAGGLALRLSLAVAAARRGEIRSVGGVDVAYEVKRAGFVLASASRTMTREQRERFDTDLGVFCLAVAGDVLPLMGVVEPAGAGRSASASRRRLPTGQREAQLSFLPDGNHGDNSVPVTQLRAGGAR